MMRAFDPPRSAKQARSSHLLNAAVVDLDAVLTPGPAVRSYRPNVDDAAKPLAVDVDLPERFGYRVKRRFLGPPLTSDQLDEQRLANPVAFGVLAPDCISSSAYGSEEILIELLPYAGMAAFALVLPITGVILGILLLLLFSYRQVVRSTPRPAALTSSHARTSVRASRRSPRSRS